MGPISPITKGGVDYLAILETRMEQSPDTIPSDWVLNNGFTVRSSFLSRLGSPRQAIFGSHESRNESYPTQHQWA